MSIFPIRRTSLAFAAILLMCGCRDATAPLTPPPTSAVSPNLRLGGLSIQITDGPPTMVVGQTAPFTAKATDIRGRPIPDVKITWFSSQPEILSINDGVAQARQPGTATIFAVFYGGIAARRVTVTSAPPTPEHMLLEYQSSSETLERASTIRSDGSDEALLPLDAGFHQFDLSPDHQRLTFAKAFDDRIFISANDGTSLTVIVPNNINYGPRWSSDGSRIVWVRETGYGGASREIFIMSADGSNQQQRTSDGYEDNSPVFSPDGGRIVFQSNRSGNFDLWMMNADGSNLTQITTDVGRDGAPEWSPDGSRISFISDRTGTPQVFTMNTDGSNVRQLTTGVVRTDARPLWSPDGTRIAFGRDESGQGTAWTMDPDGTNAVRFRVPASTRAYEFITAWRK